VDPNAALDALARQQDDGRALLVCSPGGHLVQMLALEPAWRSHETKWVTLPSADVDYLLAGQDVVFGRGPTNRSLRNLIRNFRVAWRTIRDYKPDVILSTGAALAVPFFIVGRLHRRRCVYVESYTRINELSWSGRMVYPLASAFFVQWPGLAQRLRKATHAGSVV
jgi:UDP-N-acetylglucosamine:LPS N-acetylglucosamine transferase